MKDSPYLIESWCPNADQLAEALTEFGMRDPEVIESVTRTPGFHFLSMFPGEELSVQTHGISPSAGYTVRYR